LQDEPGTISRNTGQANQGDSTAALSRDQAVRVVRKYCRSMNRNHPFWYLTALQKTRDFIDYFVLLIGRQLRKHRQRYDFRSDSLGDRKISKLVTQMFVGLLEVKRDGVVNPRAYVRRGEMGLQALSLADANYIEMMNRSHRLGTIRADDTLEN